MSYKRITAEMVESWNVCPRALRNFKRLFPKGATCTLANCRKAGRVFPDALYFAGEELFSRRIRRTMDGETRAAFGACLHAGNPTRGKLRAALNEANAVAFHRLAKGILR